MPITLLCLFKRNDFYFLPKTANGLFDLPSLEVEALDQQIVTQAVRGKVGVDHTITGVISICRYEHFEGIASESQDAVHVLVELNDTREHTVTSNFPSSWDWQWKTKDGIRDLGKDGVAFDAATLLDRISKSQIAPLTLFSQQRLEQAVGYTDLERSIIHTSRYSDQDQRAMQRVFAYLCGTQVGMTFESFVRFWSDVVQQTTPIRWAETHFVPMNTKCSNAAPRRSGVLTFREFVVGCAAMEMTTMHGGESGQQRSRLIFRRYATSVEDKMTRAELLRLAEDCGRHGASDAALRLLQEDGMLSSSGFVAAVGSLQLRGTSSLWRRKGSIIEAVRAYVARKSQPRGPEAAGRGPAQEVSSTSRPSRGDRAVKKRRLEVDADDSSEMDSDDTGHTPPGSRRPTPSGMRQPADQPTRPDTAHVASQTTEPRPEPMEAEPEQAEAVVAKDYEVTFYQVDAGLKGIKDWVEQIERPDSDAVTQSAQMQIAAQNPLPFERPNPYNACQMLKALDYFCHDLPAAQRRNNLPKRAFDWGSEVRPDNQATCMIKLAEDARKIFSTEPRFLRIPAPCYVMGDIHGNMEDLEMFHDQFWPLGVLHAPFNVLFLGDYVDRGQHGCEVVGYLFAQKVLAPDKFFLLRGNHEERSTQKNFTFHKECLERFGEPRATHVWEAINRAFDAMPIAAEIDKRVFGVHGGIPHPTLLPEGAKSIGEAVDAIECPLQLSSGNERAARSQTVSLAFELMWNDPEWSDTPPVKLDAHGFGPNAPRGKGVRVFSSQAVQQFLARNGYEKIIRAHEVKNSGFQMRYSAQLTTVFSSSRYRNDNSASCVLITAQPKQMKVFMMKRSHKALIAPARPSRSGPADQRPSSAQGQRSNSPDNPIARSNQSVASHSASESSGQSSCGEQVANQSATSGSPEPPQVGARRATPLTRPGTTARGLGASGVSSNPPQPPTVRGSAVQNGVSSNPSHVPGQGPQTRGSGAPTGVGSNLTVRGAPANAASSIPAQAPGQVSQARGAGAPGGAGSNLAQTTRGPVANGVGSNPAQTARGSRGGGVGSNPGQLPGRSPREAARPLGGRQRAAMGNRNLAARRV